MRREDVLDVLQKIEKNSVLDVTKTVIVLRYGAAISLETLVRPEIDYMVVRGREAGTNDESRAFFVPFEDVLFVKLDRVTRHNEVRRLMGEKVPIEDDDKSEIKVVEAKPNEAKSPTSTPPPTSPMDPAAIAKQNLLARIRAARTAGGMAGSPS